MEPGSMVAIRSQDCEYANECTNEDVDEKWKKITASYSRGPSKNANSCQSLKTRMCSGLPDAYATPDHRNYTNNAKQS